MIAPALPSDESSRLEALHGYEILDTASEEVFERITTMAARLFDVPIAVISLVDTNRQWFKSCYGLDADQTDRKVAFCAHAILSPKTLVVPDARLDIRFANNPLVTGEPHIRFYAGALLRTQDGRNIGTLCLIDHRPRSFSAGQQAHLEDMAQITMHQIELRLVAQKLVEAKQALRQAHDELETRVAERTVELARVNRALQDEILERKQAEKMLLVLNQSHVNES